MPEPTAKGGDPAKTSDAPPAESREAPEALALDLAEEWTSPDSATDFNAS